MPALAIRQDLPAAVLRQLARHEPDRRAAMRLMAIAHALDGFSRAEAARLGAASAAAKAPKGSKNACVVMADSVISV